VPSSLGPALGEGLSGAQQSGGTPGIGTSAHSGAGPTNASEADSTDASEAAQTTAGTAPETSAASGAVRTLRGTVTDAAMHSLQLTDAAGNRYALSVQDVPTDPPDAGYGIGDEILAYYTGTLDPARETQDITVLKIELVQADPTEKRLRALLDGMTTEEKCGQLFFIRYPGDDEALTAVSSCQPGGFLLFARDFEVRTAEQVRAALDACQAASEIPLLFGTDEEGGTVNRISKFRQYRAVPFWSPQALFKKGGMELVRSDTEEKAELLLKLDLNVNFAPVCDVSSDASDYIYPRAFGQDAQGTASYVRAVVGAMAEKRVGAVLKHFPGYGNNRDTHTGSAYDERALETFEASDFLPFEAGIEAGAGAVLVSHNVVACMDRDSPASLSAEVHRILREELGFEGVILTDDLSMDAIGAYADSARAAVLAVLAGNDMVLSTDYETQLSAVVAAAADGTIPAQQLDAAVARVLRWKLSLGLVQ